MVLHRQLTWSVTCANSRLGISPVAVSHIDDVLSNVRDLDVLLLCL